VAHTPLFSYYHVPPTLLQSLLYRLQGKGYVGMCAHASLS